MNRICIFMFSIFVLNNSYDNDIFINRIKTFLKLYSYYIKGVFRKVYYTSKERTKIMTISYILLLYVIRE